MKLFVGKLSYSTTETTLSDFFAEFGPVVSAKVITNASDGSSRGFGFIELEGAMGPQAIAALDGKMLDGREINVSEARPRSNNRTGGRSENGDDRGGNRSYTH
jgi:RNA recognition motif-containing protein